jgi:hypothetical protein
MRESRLLSPETVQTAVDILRPGIENLIRKQNRVALAVVVLNGNVPYTDGADLPEIWRGVIGEQDTSKWNGKNYMQNAGLKAALTWRTGLPAHVVLRTHPALLEMGDFKFGGSDIRPGIIAATSGMLWYHDLAVASAIVGMCEALTIGAFEDALKDPELRL